MCLLLLVLSFGYVTWFFIASIFLSFVIIGIVVSYGVKNFSVDYSKTLEEMIKADNNFDKFSPSINSDNFPIPDHKKGRIEKLEGKLFYGPTLEEISKQMTPNSWRVATIYETMGYCCRYKSKQEYVTISVVLDKNSFGYPGVIHFGGSICKRQVYIGQISQADSKNICVLGIRPNP